jgi:hypothetical protein
LYTVGKTGTGKSTLLRNAIIQDIMTGEGVGVIDPHGDLAEDILDHIPPWRTDDVVYFNPADLDHPISFNLLANVSPRERPLIASGIVAAFKHIWRDSWGPRLEYLLYASAAALLECHNTSLLGIQRMLVDHHYRDWVVEQVEDPMVRSFWQNEFASYDRHFLSELISPVQKQSRATAHVSAVAKYPRPGAQPRGPAIHHGPPQDLHRESLQGNPGRRQIKSSRISACCTIRARGDESSGLA